MSFDKWIVKKNDDGDLAEMGAQLVVKCRTKVVVAGAAILGTADPNRAFDIRVDPKTKLGSET